MPKATQKSQKTSTASASSTQADEDDSSTQVTATQARRVLASIPAEDVERKINDLVQFLLIMDQKKIPIKRLDINKNVLKEHSKAFPELIAKAADKLRYVFGFELVEVESKVKANKSYILVNKIEALSESPHLEWSNDDNAKMGLLMTIVSTIFMRGNIMEDTELYHFLAKLGVDVDVPHQVFGDVKKLLTQEFVRQGYLEYTRVPGTDPPSYEYTWGQRTKHETSKRNILDFMCQIYDVNQPATWTTQWNEVIREEQAVNGIDPDTGEGPSTR